MAATSSKVRKILAIGGALAAGAAVGVFVTYWRRQGVEDKKGKKEKSEEKERAFQSWTLNKEAFARGIQDPFQANGVGQGPGMIFFGKSKEDQPEKSSSPDKDEKIGDEA